MEFYHKMSCATTRDLLQRQLSEQFGITLGKAEKNGCSICFGMKKSSLSDFGEGDNQPIELWSNAVIDQKINYIHNNPVKEQFVSSAMDYVYSSARSFAGKKGLIDLEPL